MSMMCHIARIMKRGDTFRMNVADTKPYNADELFVIITGHKNDYIMSTLATGGVKSVLPPSLL